MCVDAYHLGQSNAIKGGLTGPSMNCLPRRQGPADDTLVQGTAEAANPIFSVGGAEACLTLQSEPSK